MVSYGEVIMRTKCLVLMGFVYVLSGGLQVVNAAPKEPPQGTETQNWDKNLPSASRFTVLTEFGGAAVRDNNTGLVWEQRPTLTTHTWISAIDHCFNTPIGNTRGWHLPSVVELSSLI